MSNHTLLIRTELNDNKLTMSLHRPRKFVLPTSPKECAEILEHELNGISAAFEEIVNFWVDRKMISKEMACGIMAQFCIDMVRGKTGDAIEVVDASRMKHLPTLKEVLQKNKL